MRVVALSDALIEKIERLNIQITSNKSENWSEIKRNPTCVMILTIPRNKLRKKRTIILWNVTWFSNLQIGPDVVADRGPISGGDRCRRRLLPVDVAAPPPAAAAPAPLEARCRLVQVTGQSDIVDADGIRGVLPGGAGWPFPWRPTHGLQTLEHPSPSDVVGTLSRVSPASASFPQRGESVRCFYRNRKNRVTIAQK